MAVLAICRNTLAIYDKRLTLLVMQMSPLTR